MSNPALFVESLSAFQRNSGFNTCEPLVSIIMRSYNEGWALRETLPAIQAQDYKNWELIVIDSGSRDGSVELIQEAKPAHFVQIKHEDYNPARVMNQGMALARSEFCIFLNADATPQGANWLRPLVAALRDPKMAAVFGRQIPRPDCRAIYAHDYERCFGPNRESTQWEHFFSMVSSGLRKDIWRQRGFLEKMQYSEDDEYTRWCREQGHRVVYVPDSVVMHSHNYTPQQAYKRSFGEAKALAAVWNGTPEEINFAKTVVLGWANDARRDLAFCSRQKRLREWPHAARIRWQQRRAKLAGFREGWKFYRTPGAPASRRQDFDPGSQLAAGTPALPGGNGACPPGLPRFTMDGSEALEKRLAQTCEKVLAEVRALVPDDKLEALVLGGGYGRGQGGVLKTKSGDAPYNDLEFYVFLRGNRIFNERKFHEPLQALGERLSPDAGLHVEFKVDSLRRLRRSPVTMFSYDLVSGHRILFGGENVFADCERHRDASQIPLSEAARLLFNRCTGLLLAKELLRKRELTAEDADFVGRNLAKAQLALGDAVLVAAGKYHWDCLQRRRALNELTTDEEPLWAREVQRHHAEGVDFKLHPRRILKSPEEFRAEHETVSRLAQRVWLWLESRRLNHRFSSAHEYAFSLMEKCSGTAPWRNLLLNMKTFGVRSALDQTADRYPRERLLNSLPLLLWEEPLNDLRVKRHLQKELRTTASDWQGFVAAYRAVWPKFS
ncbi:MAG TPA: glycosyltransferase family 2 protein [Verrucomicrobiae bacterium]|jgi:rhamnosyltransferase|nr:glycosyltransferase family 2 protein [Verrucomicrobiae bacterium]